MIINLILLHWSSTDEGKGSQGLISISPWLWPSIYEWIGLMVLCDADSNKTHLVKDLEQKKEEEMWLKKKETFYIFNIYESFSTLFSNRSVLSHTVVISISLI